MEEGRQPLSRLPLVGRPRLLRWIADAALSGMRCKPLPGSWNILDDSAYKPNYPSWWGEGRQREGTDLVLRENAIELHSYCRDPRDPYARELYVSLDDFVRRFVVERACREHGRDVYFLPEVWEAGYRPGLPTDLAVRRMTDWVELIKLRQGQQKTYYGELAASFMRSLRYRAARRLLAR